MKKIGKKGFTLVELLAVITIMGILMLVAIPAVSRTIENSRRDTFMDTAKAYINAVKNAVAADELYSGSTPISALGEGYYYYSINSATDSGKDLMEQGGKSSWGNVDVKGYVAIFKTIESGNQGRTRYYYGILLTDTQGRGIDTFTQEKNLKRSSVKTSSNVKNVLGPKEYAQFGSLDMGGAPASSSYFKDYTLTAGGTVPTSGMDGSSSHPNHCSALTIG